MDKFQRINELLDELREETSKLENGGALFVKVLSPDIYDPDGVDVRRFTTAQLTCFDVDTIGPSMFMLLAFLEDIYENPDKYMPELEAFWVAMTDVDKSKLN